MHETQPGQADTLNHEVRDIWNQNAPFWDEQMGEGNSFHKNLIERTQERVLNVVPDKGFWTLPAATGNSPGAWSGWALPYSAWIFPSA